MTVVRGSPGDKTPTPEDGDADPKQDRVRPVLQTNPALKDPAGRAVEGSQIQKLVQSNLMPEDRATAGEGILIDQIDQGNMILTNSEVPEGRADHVNNDNAVLTDPDLENPEVLEGGSGSVNPDNDAVPTDPKLIENYVVTLVNQNRWDEVESYLLKIINAADPLSLHPVLFLHIRRSKILHLIDTKRFDEAAAYFAAHVKGPFDEVIKLGQEKLPFASVRYLRGEINFCGSCVTTKHRKKHYHGDPKIMQHVICDYFRINVPSKIRREEPPSDHKMWQFGIRVTTPPGNSKASFRCMVCQHVFNNESIGLLQRHLKSCFMMNTQYLDQLFEACRSKVPGDRVPAAVQRTAPLLQDAASSQVNIPMVQKYLSVKDCVLLFRENLESAKMIKNKISEGPPDATWSKLLGTVLANVEVYSNMIISSLGPEVMAAPPAPNQITQLAVSPSGPVVPAEASAQGTHPVVLQSGPAVLGSFF